ncbi:MAG: hypothetical protein VYC91_04405 [Acidobacteriota bacterium]|nr:hypothetical protein [Acidobacteriota bacterium]
MRATRLILKPSDTGVDKRMNQPEPLKLTTDPAVRNTGFSQYLPPPDDEFSVEEQTYYKGWECAFQGSEDGQGKWSDSFELTFRGKGKVMAVPFEGSHRFEKKEEALKNAIAYGRHWVEQEGLGWILELAKEAYVLVSLKDYPNAYSLLPFSESEINLGDPVQLLPTGEEGTIHDGFFWGQLIGFNKITYEINRGDGLYFRYDPSGLEKLAAKI